MSNESLLNALDQIRHTADEMLLEYSEKVMDSRREGREGNLIERIERLEKAAGLALAGFEHMSRKLSEAIIADQQKETA